MHRILKLADQTVEEEGGALKDLVFSVAVSQELLGAGEELPVLQVMRIDEALIIEFFNVRVPRIRLRLMVRHKDREAKAVLVPSLHQLIPFLITVFRIVHLKAPVEWYRESLSRGSRE